MKAPMTGDTKGLKEILADEVDDVGNLHPNSYPNQDSESTQSLHQNSSHLQDANHHHNQVHPHAHLNHTNGESAHRHPETVFAQFENESGPVMLGINTPAVGIEQIMCANTNVMAMAMVFQMQSRLELHAEQVRMALIHHRLMKRITRHRPT